MEKISHQLVIATLFAIFAGLLSGSVLAQDHNCSAGCTITTCDRTVCEVWYCDGENGCRKIGQYPAPVSILDGSSATTSEAADTGSATHENKPAASKMIHCGLGRCAIQMCDRLECTVIGFEGGESFELLRYENTKGIADDLVSEFLQQGKSVKQEDSIHDH